jgi:phosphoribosylformylglycinamidine synthase II
MIYQIEVVLKSGLPDPIGASVKQDIIEFGVTGVNDVRFASVYVLDGDLMLNDVDSISREILADGTIQKYSINKPTVISKDDSYQAITVFLKPGVMDPVETSLLKAINDFGFRINSIKTGRKYYLSGSCSEKDILRLSSKIFANSVIEDVFTGHKILTEIPVASPYSFKLDKIALIDVSDDILLEISKKRNLSLNLDEMKTIRDYSLKQKRSLTDIELETIAQTWSEHCKHKTLKGLIKYEGESGDGLVRTQKIDNLLKQTVMRVTDELNKSWCISVFKDNAGIIEFDKNNAVCFKVETHNHPSAIEPYGGAGTGIGGVIRDVLGCGLGAKPVLNTDVFCFASPSSPLEKFPAGVLHPKRVFKGVVAGVRDYGNRMGIPTANGALYFDDRYLANPLVYCGTIGIMPRNKCFKYVQPGDLILLVGGRTGRDGIHGVTFASLELDEKSEMISSGAVQIGNAITEKKMMDVILQARDLGYYSAITDCGGGGLSSAIGEMAEETGCIVELQKVPLKYQGLSYTEIWISEAQERMVLSVPPKYEKDILELFNREDVEATIIGRFTNDKKLVLKYSGNLVGTLEMDFLHDGLPKMELSAKWSGPKLKEPKITPPENLGETLKQILSMPNICSKEWVIRQYDHEVQGGSVLKPLQGKDNDGPGDACVFRPILDSYRGLCVSNGMNPKYGDIDPYHMAASVIDEALRNIVAVGGNPQKTALLDNFCWGNTGNPQQLGAIVRAAQACYDIAHIYETPFISGKDSLNNEYRVSSKKAISIPYSLLISAISVIDDVGQTVSMDLKEVGDLVYIVGRTNNELGGSHYYDLLGHLGKNVPQVDAILGRRIMIAVSEAIRMGFVSACHDLSEGGLAVSAAEMAFAGDIGLEINIGSVPFSNDKERRDDIILFSESNSRFLIEVNPKHKSDFEKLMADCPFALIGKTSNDKKLKVYGLGNSLIIQETLSCLKESWQKPLKW